MRQLLYSNITYESTLPSQSSVKLLIKIADYLSGLSCPFLLNALVEKHPHIACKPRSAA